MTGATSRDARGRVLDDATVELFEDLGFARRRQVGKARVGRQPDGRRDLT